MIKSCFSEKGTIRLNVLVGNRAKDIMLGAQKTFNNDKNKIMEYLRGYDYRKEADCILDKLEDKLSKYGRGRNFNEYDMINLFNLGRMDSELRDYIIDYFKEKAMQKAFDKYIVTKDYTFVNTSSQYKRKDNNSYYVYEDDMIKFINF